MPRQSRLDVIGGVYHIISRGIERRKIFKSSEDKINFLERLGTCLESTTTQCYAWVLMDNHFHLLVRPLKDPMSSLMRMLLTGYVGYFNRRYRRSGHLFQNRYKSILCQEDVYFKQLVRYIHLNPVRAKLVNTPEELLSYEWCGHGAIMGKRKASFQETEEVLAYFGNSTRQARSYYHNFIKDGWNQGFQNKLVGGGLTRSAGGVSELKKRSGNKKQDYDSRILGDGDFVRACLEKYDKEEERRNQLKLNFTEDELLNKICKKFKVERSELFSGSRKRFLSVPKGVYVYIMTEYFGCTFTFVGKKLGMSSSNSVYKARDKGKVYIEENPRFLKVKK